MTGSGSLQKLEITGYSDPSAESGLVGSIQAVINPKSYSINYTARYKKTGESGASAPTQVFSSMESGSIDLELLVDGTGIVKLDGGTVEAYIEKLKGVVYDYQGTEHRPNYLKISWGGTAPIFIGVCSSIKIEYTLFNPDGSPLRAIVRLSVLESVAFSEKLMKSKKSSPDLTHVRTVKAGDTLPLMAFRIYGHASWYMEVARINGLNSIHDIQPGDEIYFPPLKK
ncbi:hypothetical protein KTO58_13360 [Chitinophaga pendula]|uniref:CIS tube protein n=1 Tax=Chitinophaga TaxID=79328 RepID=UPI000BAF44D3|nr:MULTISPECIES: hypothetical protein [Chitinophaga]ASZ12272.1 hypothetical protein CK934_15540 [Chitinophaga sp. MD30]UCJ10140.1 hypothetical protein KTO58_13360 [Chitinophaga pendula]